MSCDQHLHSPVFLLLLLLLPRLFLACVFALGSSKTLLIKTDKQVHLESAATGEGEQEGREREREEEEVASSLLMVKARGAQTGGD